MTNVVAKQFVLGIPPISILRWYYKMGLSILIGGLLLVLSACRPALPTTNPSIDIDSALARPGALVTVTGRGWLPGEPIYLVLKDNNVQIALNTVAVAQASDVGQFAISFIYPGSDPWRGLDNVTLTARSATGQQYVNIALTVAPIVGPVMPAAQTVAVAQPAGSRATVTDDFVNLQRVLVDVSLWPNLRASKVSW